MPILVALVQYRGFRFATAAAGAAALVIGLPLVLLVIRGRPTADEVAIELQRHGAMRARATRGSGKRESGHDRRCCGSRCSGR